MAVIRLRVGREYCAHSTVLGTQISHTQPIGLTPIIVIAYYYRIEAATNDGRIVCAANGTETTASRRKTDNVNRSTECCELRTKYPGHFDVRSHIA